LRKNVVKKITNHDLLGPWADEICTHIQKNIIKKIDKNYDKKFVDQSWLFGHMILQTSNPLFKNFINYF